MEINIENFAEEQGKKIANAVMFKHYEYPYLLGKNKKPKSFLSDITKGYKEGSEVKKMEKEIYERSSHEATVFFLKNSEQKFNNEIIKTLKFHLSTRIKQPSRLENSTAEELLSNSIKNYAVNFLL